MDSPYPGNAAQLNIDKLNTKKQNTYFTNFASLPSGEPCEAKGTEAMSETRDERCCADEYRELIKDNIDYDVLAADMPYDTDRLDEVVELIVEAVSTTKTHIRVSGADFPTDIVRARLLKLTYEHIRFVFDCLDENTTKIWQ